MTAEIKEKEKIFRKFISAFGYLMKTLGNYIQTDLHAPSARQNQKSVVR